MSPKYPKPDPVSSLLHRPPRRPQSDDPSHEDQTYSLDVVLVDPGGKPIAGVEIRVATHHTGVQSARYSDGNGFANHAIAGRPDDLCTFQTNGAKIVAATGQPKEGAGYLYLPTDARVSVQLSLEIFKSALRPVPVLPRGPLPPFTEPINYRTTLPW